MHFQINRADAHIRPYGGTCFFYLVIVGTCLVNHRLGLNREYENSEFEERVIYFFFNQDDF